KQKQLSEVATRSTTQLESTTFATYQNHGDVREGEVQHGRPDGHTWSSEMAWTRPSAGTPPSRGFARPHPPSPALEMVFQPNVTFHQKRRAVNLHGASSHVRYASAQHHVAVCLADADFI